MVQTGTGLPRSQRRNAQILASTTLTLRAHPPEPRPAARQTQAEASDEAPASIVVATASAVFSFRHDMTAPLTAPPPPTCHTMVDFL